MFFFVTISPGQEVNPDTSTAAVLIYTAPMYKSLSAIGVCKRATKGIIVSNETKADVNGLLVRQGRSRTQECEGTRGVVGTPTFFTASGNKTSNKVAICGGCRR